MGRTVNQKEHVRSGLPLARDKEIVIQDTNNELLIYDLKTNKALHLNETAAMVWSLCDGRRSAAQICEEMGLKLNTTVSEDLARLALDYLDEHKLLSTENKRNCLPVETSRREMLKNVAATSLIALPLISSVVAPKAINAQSNSCARGVCFSAGQDYCAGYLGQTITATGHTSNNGTCMGIVTSVSVTCSGVVGDPFDVSRT